LIFRDWEAIDLERGELHVNRAKNGSPSVHPLSGKELHPQLVARVLGGDLAGGGHAPPLRKY
jgi:hypothetical protein